MSEITVELLQRAVTRLRENHAFCPHNGCPWRIMWSEDVAELWAALQGNRTDG